VALANNDLANGREPMTTKKTGSGKRNREGDEVEEFKI